MNQLSSIINSDKVLVTGGSGFIGTNLIEDLLLKEIDVINFDIVPPRDQTHINYYKYVDITDYLNLKKAFQEIKPTIVIHLAARTDLGGKKISDYSANVKGVDNLCRIISDSASTSHVIFASSMLVCAVGVMPINDKEYHPTTVYGESKVLTEKIIRKYHKKMPDYKIVRPTSIWGPWFKEPYADFFNMVISGRYLNIGGKSCIKTYGYVKNAVNQILVLLTLKSEKGNVFYLGDTPPVNIAEWANEISTQLKDKKVRSIPFFIFKIAALLGDVIIYFGGKFPMSSFRLQNMTTNNVIDKSKIPSIQGVPSKSLKCGVEETLFWIKSNDERIKNEKK
jgi:nucleoside-diphosphate-sugar epimerase